MKLEVYEAKTLEEAKAKALESLNVEENEILFFPEVILSLRLKYDYTISAKSKQTPLSPIQQLERNNKFVSNEKFIFFSSLSLFNAKSTNLSSKSL